MLLSSIFELSIFLKIINLNFFYVLLVVLFILIFLKFLFGKFLVDLLIFCKLLIVKFFSDFFFLLNLNFNQGNGIKSFGQFKSNRGSGVLDGCIMLFIGKEFVLFVIIILGLKFMRLGRNISSSGLFGEF